MIILLLYLIVINVMNVEYVKGKLVVCVADSGIGMSETHIQLFYLSGRRFDYRELPELAGRNLTETLAIVRMLKGSIKVFSDAGKGCKFIIILFVIYLIPDNRRDINLKNDDVEYIYNNLKINLFMV